MFKEEECSYYNKGKCLNNKERSSYCEGNDGNEWNRTLCSVREQHYKDHPETYIQFGKYKYMEYQDIPNNYVAWLLKQELKPDLKKYLENAIIENKIAEIKENKETIIKDFINKYYSTRRCYKSSRSHYKHSTSGCPEWLDYGGDVFDVMQGCGINGD